MHVIFSTPNQTVIRNNFTITNANITNTPYSALFLCTQPNDPLQFIGECSGKFDELIKDKLSETKAEKNEEKASLSSRICMCSCFLWLCLLHRLRGMELQICSTPPPPMVYSAVSGFACSTNPGLWSCRFAPPHHRQWFILLPLALPAPPTLGYGAAGLLHSTTANGGIGMPPICFSTARVSGIAIIHSRWNSPLALSAVTCERNGIQRSASLVSAGKVSISISCPERIQR